MVAGAERAWHVSGTSGVGEQGGAPAGCGVPASASAVEASVSAVDPAGAGFLRIWPADQVAPNATFVNYSRLQATTNTGTIPLSATGVVAARDFAATTQVVIDVQGYFLPVASALPAGASMYVPMTPCRIVDTRAGGGPLAAGTQRQWHVSGSTGFAAQGGGAGGCGVPAAATAVEASVSAVDPRQSGFLRLWPAGQAVPTATFVNYSRGRPTTNTGTISLSATGELGVRNYAAGANAVVDIQGYFVAVSTSPRPPGASLYVPRSPCRAVDTRATTPLAPGTSRLFQIGGLGHGFVPQGGTAWGCGVPDGATAAELSITAVSPTANGYQRAWPSDADPPKATFVNFARGQSTTNTGAITLAATAQKDLTTAGYGGSAHYVIDVQGYFVDPAVPLPAVVVTTHWQGQFNPGYAISQAPGLLPVVHVGADLALLEPRLAAPVRNVSAVMKPEAPVTGDPTWADIPTGGWQEVDDSRDAARFGTTIPMAVVGAIIPGWTDGSALWQRSTMTDANGMTDVSYTYYPSLPVDDSAATLAWELVEGQVVKVPIAAAPGPNQEGPITAFDLPGLTFVQPTA